MAVKRLSGLEQLVMDYVWKHPKCTVVACREALSESSHPLKETTVRTILQRLENKGFVKHDVEGRLYLYSASEPRRKFAAQAVKQIMDRFCGGSLEELLVGMAENDVVDRRELAELARKIASKKREVK